ncbi:MAG: hypothetical protein AAGJ35_13075, partial [Myxococcota bacterium]
MWRPRTPAVAAAAAHQLHRITCQQRSLSTVVTDRAFHSTSIRERRQKQKSNHSNRGGGSSNSNHHHRSHRSKHKQSSFQSRSSDTTRSSKTHHRPSNPAYAGDVPSAYRKDAASKGEGKFRFLKQIQERKLK